MSCLGVHFALTPQQEQRLLAAERDEAVHEVIEQIEEEEWDAEYVQESDKSWDAMHRVLADGTLEPGGGEYPLNRTVLGGRELYKGIDYIVCYVPAEEVKDVARALLDVTEEWFRERYWCISHCDYDGHLSDEDLEYTWGWFGDVREFYQRATAANRAVIFTADQ